jgi:hypothetical protein
VNIPHWLAGDGYLGWRLFTVIVFTLVVFLLADYGWRIVRVRFFWLGSVAAVVWIAGLIGLYSV